MKGKFTEAIACKVNAFKSNSANAFSVLIGPEVMSPI